MTTDHGNITDERIVLVGGPQDGRTMRVPPDCWIIRLPDLTSLRAMKDPSVACPQATFEVVTYELDLGPMRLGSRDDRGRLRFRFRPHTSTV